MEPRTSGDGQVHTCLFIRSRGIRLERSDDSSKNERANRERAAHIAGDGARKGAVYFGGSLLWWVQCACIQRPLSCGGGGHGSGGCVTRGPLAVHAAWISGVHEKIELNLEAAKAAGASAHYV